jgi:DNA-binding Lrp family transcriptional regulator
MKKTKRDMLVLSHLRQNARRTLTQMSRFTRVPISTLHEIIKSKKDWRYTVITDFAQLGFQIKAQVYLKVRKDQKNDLRSHLKGSFCVNSLYKVNNGYDFMCEVVCKDLNSLESFLETVDDKFTVKSKDIHHVMEDIKKEAFMACPDLLPSVSY